MFRFKTLQAALFATFVGLVLFSLIVFALLATPRIKSTAITHIGWELYRQMSLVSGDVNSLVGQGASRTQLQAKAKEIAKFSKSRVTVIDKQGRVLADSSTPLAKLRALDNHGARPEVVEARQTGRGRAVRYSETLGKDLIYVAVPLAAQRGYLRFAVPTIYAADLVLKIHKSMLVALVLAIIVAITVSILFSRSFSRPIVRLSGISRRIAEGKVPFAIPRRSKFEIGKLEHAVEQMSHKLADTFQKLSHEHSELKKLESYRSEFVANVSHELKTPLTAIRNYVETLSAGAIDDQVHNQEFLKKIEKHAVNLSALIDDILAISNLEAKKDIGQFTRVDLGGLIARAMETISAKAEKKKVKISFSCAGGQCLVAGIEEHLYRAILNLLDNAVNYTEPGGQVEISCLKREKQLEITVTDTGAGIPIEHLPRIFERFYRVDKARSRELGGTGLGLAIVKHVMNIHNGSVSVQSEVGRGSTFTLILPLN